MGKSIEVEIFGRKYPIVATKDEEYIKKLAEIVDAKMNEISLQLPDLSATGTAVLACLNLADEIESFKKFSENKNKSIEEMVISLAGEIDSRLCSFK